MPHVPFLPAFTLLWTQWSSSFVASIILNIFSFVFPWTLFDHVLASLMLIHSDVTRTEPPRGLHETLIDAYLDVKHNLNKDNFESFFA